LSGFFCKIRKKAEQTDACAKASGKTGGQFTLTPLPEWQIELLYRWTAEEPEMERFTCRPVGVLTSPEAYAERTLTDIAEGKKRIYLLCEDGGTPLGKITLFDLNARNRSAEFGYYLPVQNRGRGLGAVMLQNFLNTVFSDEALCLNKLYATTASNNIPSVSLLKRHGFTLDGRMREHYWIGADQYDQLIFSMLKREWMGACL
jgi:Acetyltransferases, including N-acetylases of ribosomal proteins